MKPHYDFSKAERGKFYRKGARVRLPIYLDGQLQERLERIAQKKGRDLGDVVGDLLIKDVELLGEGFGDRLRNPQQISHGSLGVS